MSTASTTATIPHACPLVPILGSDVHTYRHHVDSALDDGPDEVVVENCELHAIPTHLSGRSKRSSAISQSSIIVDSAANNHSRGEFTIPEVQEVTANIHKIGSTDLPSCSNLTFKSKNFKRNGMIHFVVLCWCIFVEGWNDGSTGPLLPVFQSHYQIGFSIVSLYFVSNCAGYMIAAALNVWLNVWLNDKIGFGKIMLLGSMFQLIAYTIQASGPPFPVMVFANSFTGFGMSLQSAQANGFVGSLKQHVSTKLGIMHAAYGFGAFVSPFVATYFSGTRRWYFHYIVSATMAIINTLLLVLVFRLKPIDELLANAGQAPEELGVPRENKFRQIIGLRALHIMAIFSLIYIGTEVTLGGWIVTFIIHKRGGGHSAGYISSGFWGGLTLGRIGLMWFNKLVGERQVIFLYSIITIGLQITIWFVPSIIENAVAVSLIGILLGPMYPVLMSHATKILPRWLVTVCLGWITGIGIAGSAALPFLTGLLASRFGIGALQPLLVSMMCMMVVVWAFVPRAIHRVD